MSNEIWTAMQNLLTATENNSSAIDALARSARSNREYIEALTHTQVVLFQLLMKEMCLSQEVMAANLSALAGSETTPETVRELLQLHRDACNAAAEEGASQQKRRPEWYQGTIDGNDPGEQEPHPPEEKE